MAIINEAQTCGAVCERKFEGRINPTKLPNDSTSSKCFHVWTSKNQPSKLQYENLERSRLKILERSRVINKRL